MFYSFRAVVDGQRVAFTENNPVEGKYEAIVILTMPLNSNTASLDVKTAKLVDPPAIQKDNAVPVAVGTQLVRPVSALTHSSDLRQSAIGERSSNLQGFSTSGMPVQSLSASVKDDLSLLYHDKAKREARRNSSAGSGDKYVDVNRDAYQRLMQGDQIPLTFDEGGTYITSPFILVENGSQLYINFYQYNDNKPVPHDKVKILSQIFEIKGDFPNFIGKCKPALMIPTNRGYVIKNKGELLLER
jgi:hypothetical protein